MRDTPQRREVLNVLATATGGPAHHLTAGQIHQRLLDQGSTVDKATVYRTLATLTELGLVHEVSDANGTTYGQAQHSHHHAICTQCGKVNDLPATAAVEAVRIAQHAAGFSSDATLTLHGVCTDCRAVVET
jgi:Fur family ferric uptake transcriptional regulator